LKQKIEITKKKIYMGELRLIRPMKFPDLEFNEECGELPEIEWCLPSTLFVDESYQRSLSRRSVELIKNVVKNWNWNKFKPPICVKHQNGYEVIDGQHTAIAACTHPKISRIPVVLVNADELKQRANSFVSHNSNRINVTPTQIFHSKIAAGDEECIQINSVCQEEGIIILRNVKTIFKEGETRAISNLQKIYNEAGPAALRRVCNIIAYGKFKPVESVLIRGIRELLISEEYKKLISLGANDEDLKTVVRAVGQDITQISKRMSIQTKKKNWECVSAFYASKMLEKLDGL